MLAGGNILRIGFDDFLSNWHGHLIYVLEVLLILVIFIVLIFYRLVKKHHLRILQIDEKKVPFYLFFDIKSYLIMILMITGGLLIRKLHILPDIVIGVLYSGIGLSLEGAGILLLTKFAAASKDGSEKELDRMISKTYINISFIYAIAALASGVFYREFTRAVDFAGSTTLAYTHLHIFILGTIMFLIIAIFCGITNLTQQKQFGHFMLLYNIGLPFMVVMFYVKGIIQALGIKLSTGASAAFSGLSGVAHIIMTVAIIALFLALRRIRIVANGGK
ncbi:hypothetical protein MASR2M70_20870 [Bacillota bacterium]